MKNNGGTDFASMFVENYLSSARSESILLNGWLINEQKLEVYMGFSDSVKLLVFDKTK